MTIVRVLVTGSSGRVGGMIAAALSATHQLVGLDRVPGMHTSVRVDLADAADRDELADALRGVDALIHCAALHAPHVGQASEARFQAVNVDATARLLDAAMRAGVRRLVYTSTTSLYGDAMLRQGRAVWVDEALTPEPRDIYDRTKLAAEALCRQAAAAGLPGVGLRMSRCFPEPDLLMAIYRMYRGVDGRDVAEAHRLALACDSPGFEIFNVSARPPFEPNDAEALWADAAAVIRRRLPWAEAAFARRGWALPQRIDRVYAIGRAERMLNYRPAFNVDALFSPAERRIARPI